jgi:hypothetical protein
MGLSLDDILTVARKAAGKNNKFNYVKKIIENHYAERSEGGPEGTKPGSGTSRINRKKFYEERRRDSELAAQARTEEVYGKLPVVEMLDREIASLNMEYMQAVTSGASNKKTVLSRLKQNIREKTDARAAAMSAGGFSPAYTDILYHCPLCKDSGTLDNGVSCSCFMIQRETL